MPDAVATNHAVTEALATALKSLAGSLASYSALGSFALYVAGYLALRFHLTTLGVATDLAVLDERYVFTGARFVIYLAAALPAVLLLLLPFAGIGWLLTRWRPLREFTGKLLSRFADPAWLAVYGGVAAVFIIQMAMRQAFNLGNLLLAQCLPEPGWMITLLREGEAASLYFTALAAGVLLTGGLWYAARRCTTQTVWSRRLTALLGALVVIQCLLLPVNYGVLVVDKTLPRVADLGGVETLTGEQQAWLVWESDKGVTWLVRRDSQTKELITLSKSEVKKMRVTGYDSLARLLAEKACVAP